VSSHHDIWYSSPLCPRTSASVNFSWRTWFFPVPSIVNRNLILHSQSAFSNKQYLAWVLFLMIRMTISGRSGMEKLSFSEVLRARERCKSYCGREFICLAVTSTMIVKKYSWTSSPILELKLLILATGVRMLFQFDVQCHSQFWNLVHAEKPHEFRDLVLKFIQSWKLGSLEDCFSVHNCPSENNRIRSFLSSFITLSGRHSTFYSSSCCQDSD